MQNKPSSTRFQLKSQKIKYNGVQDQYKIHFLKLDHKITKNWAHNFFHKNLGSTKQKTHTRKRLLVTSWWQLIQKENSFCSSLSKLCSPKWRQTQQETLYPVFIQHLVDCWLIHFDFIDLNQEVLPNLLAFHTYDSTSWGTLVWQSAELIGLSCTLCWVGGYQIQVIIDFVFLFLCWKKGLKDTSWFW